MKKYELVLKNEKIKSYSRISWLIIILNFLFFAILAAAEFSDKISYSFFAATLMIVMFLYDVMMKRKDSSQINPGFYFIIPIIAFLLLGFYWFAIIDIILLSLHIITRRKIAVMLYEEYIIYPSFPNKWIQWPSLHNLMLKDGLLTIDFENNKLIQHEIDDSKAEINEKEFNIFCREQLAKKRPLFDDYNAQSDVTYTD